MSELAGPGAALSAMTSCTVAPIHASACLPAEDAEAHSEAARLSLLPSSESLDISEVLRSAGCLLVLEKRSETDDRNPPSFELEALCVDRGLIEGDAVCAIQNINPPRRKTDLKDSVVGGKVVDLHLEGGERRAERREGFVDSRRVLGRCPSTSRPLVARGCPWKATA